jgi:pimeloyl-ACP methyl ester carboxylesterase
MVTEDFEFLSGGRKLSGFIDQPANGEARALIVFVHGSGPTDIRRENRYVDLRQRFAQLGIASVVWDKPGRGRSEGEFDPNQRLAESAREVLDAVALLRREDVPGAQKIGIWGASRGGWVAPMALAQDPEIEFWISVSGVPAADNKYYLMESNLPLEGRTLEETQRLMEEWKRGREIAMEGGDYDAYLAATRNLRSDTSVLYFAGDLTGSRAEYEAEQAAFLRARDEVQFDENLSAIRVRDFDIMLSSLDIDVLALLGERDTNVDWQAAKALYEGTIGRNDSATLSIRTFPECNHSLNVSKTGSVREVEGTPLNMGAKCAGYYETQLEWLKEYVVPDPL